MEKPLKRLKLESLHERHVGLTPSLAGTYYETASVCLSRHHISPVDLRITRGERSSLGIVEFAKPHFQMLRAYANDIDTTETGAYGLCLAAVEVEEALVAVGRAEKLTGADWYVAPIGKELEDLEHCYRLEVSGIDAGNRASIEARLRQKVEQTKRGASNLPAIASVVGFKEKAVAIELVSDNE